MTIAQNLKPDAIEDGPENGRSFGGDDEMVAIGGGSRDSRDGRGERGCIWRLTRCSEDTS